MQKPVCQRRIDAAERNREEHDVQVVFMLTMTKDLLTDINKRYRYAKL
jgi:hypothetical protein